MRYEQVHPQEPQRDGAYVPFGMSVKYRKAVFTEEVEQELRAVCKEIEERYEVAFLEIGVDKNHVHFLVQSVPSYSPTKIVRTVKSLTAREIFKRVPKVKKTLWGGEFWSKGYFMATVGKHGSEGVISSYVNVKVRGSTSSCTRSSQACLVVSDSIPRGLPRV